MSNHSEPTCKGILFNAIGGAILIAVAWLVMAISAQIFDVQVKKIVRETVREELKVRP